MVRGWTGDLDGWESTKVQPRWDTSSQATEEADNLEKQHPLNKGPLLHPLSSKPLAFHLFELVLFLRTLLIIRTQNLNASETPYWFFLIRSKTGILQYQLLNNLMTQVLLLLALLVTLAHTQSDGCADYIQRIDDLFKTNKTEALIESAPYLAVSGKRIEDLGFPERCQITPNVFYSTLEFNSNMNGQLLTTYYGLCFNDACTAQGLNDNMGTILHLLRQADIEIPQNVTVVAVNPRLQHTTSTGAIVMITAFCVIIAAEMFYSVKKWILQCHNKEDIQQRYTFEDGQVFQEEEMTLIRKVSLEYKMGELFSAPEKTTKIVSFSAFKVFCIPLVVVGQEFFYRNFAAFNIFAFKQQVYTTFYSNVAVFSVYLPDTLFFISAYLLATKCLQSEASMKFLSNQLIKKVLRLYPVYFAILVIYWVISPSLHQGPVWYVYENQANVCNSRWWAAMLLIDNWFSTSCYPGGWFVQAEFQFVIFTLLFFFFFSKFKIPALVVYLVGLIVMLVLTIVLSSKMPVSIENTINPEFREFYFSTHAHFFFYLLGMGLAFLRKMEALSLKISEFYENKKIIDLIIQCFGLGIILLVLFRPSLWSGGSQFEFALSRIGVFLGFLTFFMGGIFRPEDYENSSTIHRFAHYSYPIMLISFVVTLCSVWGLSSFSYVNGLDLLNLMVSETLLSIVVGTFLGVLLETNVFKKSSN